MPLLLLFEGEKHTDEETGGSKEIDGLELSRPSPSPARPASDMYFTWDGELQMKVSDDRLNKMRAVI